jgi:N-acetylglucosaminyl-diphospho-decaprenol L-rhamnosyltransferase
MPRSYHEASVSAASPEDRVGRAVSVVVVTYNGLPWVEQCLESLRGNETIVVDHSSTDGTIELVRGRFPDARVIEQENAGLGAGSNAGMRVASGDYFLLLNSDAWAVGDAVERLAAFAEEHPEAAVVGPRLLNPDGSLQPSVRGFPTLWRLATEYFFLRKLAPRSRALNAFYGSRFAHDEVREAEFLMGACLLVRRQAADTVGLFDEDFFMFSEETDWCYRFRQAGWNVLFTPEAEFVHVGGATTARNWGPMYREQLRGHLRFMAKHHGVREAERARRLLLASMRLRSVVFRGDRRRMSREAAKWLSGSSVPELLEAPA